MAKTTTLSAIYEFGPCAQGQHKLLNGLNKAGPDDEPLLPADILRINGIADAIWAMRTQPIDDITDLACRYAEGVACLNSDPRFADALGAARGVVLGTHTRVQARRAGAMAGLKAIAAGDSVATSTYNAAAHAAQAAAAGMSHNANAAVASDHAAHAAHAAVRATIAAARATGEAMVFRERIFLDWAMADPISARVGVEE